MSIKRQFLRFVSVGMAGTALHYLVLIGLVSGLAWDPAKAAVMGASVGAISNYWLNHRYSFESHRHHREALPRFLLMAGLGVLLNGVIVKALTWAGTHYFIAQIVATTAVLGLNFFVSRKWIFIKEKKTK
jgi:putative flippase GtrA